HDAAGDPGAPPRPTVRRDGGLPGRFGLPGDAGLGHGQPVLRHLGGMVVGPVLVAISAPLRAAAIRREADPRMAKSGARGSMTPRTWPIARPATRPFPPPAHRRTRPTDTPRRTAPLRVAAQSATAEHSSPIAASLPRLIEASINLDHLILPDGRLATSDVSGGGVKRRFVRRDARGERVSCDGPRRGRPGAPSPPT